MAEQFLHPLEVRFVELALQRGMVKPSQAQRCQDLLFLRLARGEKYLGIDQLFQEEGLLTDAESETLWELIANTSDSQLREQIKERKGTEPGAPLKLGEQPEVRPALKPADSPVPDRIAGYEVLEWIGRGGMGAVYKARQLNMDRVVALKLLPPELASNAKYIRRFIREARAAGRINHGNLVRVYDVGEAEGRYFISMEYVEGLTVKQLLRREGRLSAPLSLRIIEQVAEALDCAHQYQIIHRDIKPDNIMLDTQGIAKLCDLGLAKVLEAGPLSDSDTQEGLTMGTPHYMSPEQARAADKVDARSDLYSLGATLFHMLTGRVPFEGETSLEVLMKVTGEPPPRPDRFDPLLPPPLTRLILRLLAKQRSERPASGKEVAREVRLLRRDLEDGRIFIYEDAPRLELGQPIQAPSRRTEARRKNYWALGLLAAVCFLLVCILARAGRRTAPIPSPKPPLSLDPGKASAGTRTGLPRDPPSLPPPQPPSHPGPDPSTVDEDPLPRLRLYERWLTQNPSTFRQVLAKLKELQAPPRPLSPEARAWCEKVRGLAQACAAREALRQLEARLPGAAALAAAGLFRRAAQFLAEADPEAADSALLRQRREEELRKLTQLEQADTRRQEVEIRQWMAEGLLRIAEGALTRWGEELRRDEAAPTDPRRLAAAGLERALAQARERRLTAKLLEAHALGAAQASRGLVLALAQRHEFPEARRVCSRQLAANPRELERNLLLFEQQRLERIQELFATVEDAVSLHPNRLKERDFSSGSSLNGTIQGFNERHMALKLGPGNNEAFKELQKFSRDELRAFFALVFDRQRLTENHPLGRLAYDLGDPLASLQQAARRALPGLARGDEKARNLLERCMRCEEALALAQGTELLSEAEELLGRHRPGEARMTVAAALSALGQDPSTELWERAQSLLRLAAQHAALQTLVQTPCEVRSRQRVWARYPPEALLARPGDWTWSAPPTLRPQGGLAFAAEPAQGQHGWRLGSPATVRAALRIPAQAEGQFTLWVTAGPDPQASAGQAEPGLGAWRLIVRRNGGRSEVGLGEGNREPGGWRALAEHPGERTLPLSLELDVGFLAWQTDQDEKVVVGTAPVASWQVRLEGSGALILDEVGMECLPLDAPRLEEREAAAERAVQEALGFSGEAGEARLLGLLKSQEMPVAVASRICAELAKAARGRLEPGEACYWECRALFACPAERWPTQTRELLEGHRRWQQIRRQFGPPPPDPRQGAPYLGFRLMPDLEGGYPGSGRGREP